MKYFCFDTETSGLWNTRAKSLDKLPHIFEWYSCLADENGNDLSEINELLNPGVKVTAEITKITKITQDMINGKPNFASIADRIIEQLNEADAIVAHNLEFDLGMLDFEMKRIGKEYKLPDHRYCTVEISESLDGYRLKLIDLHEKLFGHKFESSHRAKEDVQATKRCFFKLKEMGEI